MELSDALELAQQHGFSQWGPVNIKKLRFFPEVRDMCKAGSCGQYGRSWSCPPCVRYAGGGGAKSRPI